MYRIFLKIYFFVAITFVLVYCAACLPYEWTEMGVNDIFDFYLPYERCVLQLDDSSFDLSVSIFKQPPCLALLGKNATVVEQTVLQHAARCMLGGKQQRQDDGICIGKRGGMVRYDKKKQFCISLHDRPSLYRKWTGLPVRQFPALDLVNSVINSKYETLAFVGDSMAAQKAQRLACLLLRKGIEVKLFGQFFAMPPSGAAASVIFPNSTQALQLAVYRLQNGLGGSALRDHQQGAIQGIAAACGKPNERNETCALEFRSQHIYQRTFNHFKFAARGSDTLYLVTIPIRLKFAWEYHPFAKAVLEISERLRPIRSKLIILSPFAQHFRSHPIGLYDNFTKPGFNSTICGAHQVHVDDHPEAILFQQAIAKIDAKWQQKVGYFSLFQYSVPMYDLHSETHSTGWSVDCTHYFFQPTMFDAIWVDLGSYISRFSQL